MIVNKVSKRYYIGMDNVRLFELTEQIGSLLRSAKRNSENNAGLQPVHYQVLAYLGRCNRFSNTPAAVTAYLAITKGTVSQSLSLLERKGLVCKAPDLKDRRVVHLHLTRQGIQLLEGTMPPSIWKAACESLNEAELYAIQSSVESLLRSLQRANNSRMFGICHTCRYLINEKREYFCGLTDEKLEPEETMQICHEHAFPDAA
ncbi:MAG: MarR family winged helix-turn-helix transcriptional regulator [Mariprofundaceae bacterium]